MTPGPVQNPDMSLALQAHLAEFHELRNAIRSRVDSQQRCIYFAVAAAGTVFSLAVTSESLAILMALPYVLFCLFLNHWNHSDTIAVVAVYIKEDLAKKISVCTGDEVVLGFEAWIHEKKIKHLNHTHTKQVLLLFGLTPLFSCVLSAYALDWGGSSPKSLSLLLLWFCTVAATLSQAGLVYWYYWQRMKRKKASANKSIERDK